MTDQRLDTLYKFVASQRQQFVDPEICDQICELIAGILPSKGQAMTDKSKPDRQGLLPCPFCAKPLSVSPNKINPFARCVTEDCYGGRMPIVNLHDPVSVAQWNTRSPPLPTRDAAELERARQEVVLAISFLGRDSNTERLQATVDALIPGLAKADAILRSFVSPSGAGAAEPVAWRWRPWGSAGWIYDPTPEWREANKTEAEFQPLYATPRAPTR